MVDDQAGPGREPALGDTDAHSGHGDEPHLRLAPSAGYRSPAAMSGMRAHTMESAGRTGELPLRCYGAVMRLAETLAPVVLRYRERIGKEDGARRGERLGLASRDRPDGHLIWLHAASVGETNAIIPLIHRLAETHPDFNLLLTTGTVTSAVLAKERLGDVAIHQFVPLDGPTFLRRFLDHWRPDLAVFVESEV